MRSDGATVYLYGEEAIAPDSDNKVGSDEKNISDNEAAKASNKNITSYKREVEQKICSMVNQYYKKRDVFFSQGVTLFALWIVYIFLSTYLNGGYRKSAIEGHTWVRDVYIHLNSEVLIVGGICILIQIIGCILGMLSSSCITLTDNKVYGKSSFIHRFNISLGEIKEVRFLERFNTLEIQTGNETVKLLFMKSGGELKEKIEETLNKYNNSGERYQETRFSDEKGKSIWKLILSVAWNLFLICLAYIYLFAVPNVKGLDIKEAEELLTKRGIKYTKEAEFPSFTMYDTGYVLDDGGAAYFPIFSVETVSLKYIGGVTTEQLDDLIGKTLDDAYQILNEAGCSVYYNEAYSESVPEGCIITWETNSYDYISDSYVFTVSLGAEPKSNNYSTVPSFSTGTDWNSNGEWDVKIVVNMEEDNYTSEYNGFSAYYYWYVHFICQNSVSTAKASLTYNIKGSYGSEYEDTIDGVEDGDVWTIKVPEYTFEVDEDVTITAYIDGVEVSNFDVWISYK